MKNKGSLEVGGMKLNESRRAKAIGVTSLQIMAVCFSMVFSMFNASQIARSATWGLEQEISTDSGSEDQWNVSLAVDGNNVHVVWQDTEDGDSDIYYRHFDGTSWQSEVEISTDDNYHWHPRIAVDGGKLHVVWSERYDYAAEDLEVYYRYFDGTSWQSEQDISDDTGTEDQEAPDVAVVGDKVHAVWQDEEDGEYDIYYRYFDGTSWQAKQDISSEAGSRLQFDPAIAAEGDKVYVVWEDTRGGDYDIYFRYYDGTSWQGVQEISTDGGSEWQFNPQIAVDNGKAHVVWSDPDDGDSDIHYRSFDGTSWSSETKINVDTGSEGDGFPSISVEGDKIYAAWIEFDGGDQKILYRYFDGTSWNSEETISSTAASVFQKNSRPPTRAASGFVHIAWTDDRDGDYDIYCNNGTEGAGGDSEPPISSASTVTPYWHIAGTYDVDWTATDNENLANISLHYKYSPDNSSWSAWSEWDYDNTISGTAASGSFSFTSPNGDGYYEFYTNATDASGNEEAMPASADTPSGLDTNIPTGSISINSGNVWTTSTSVNLDLTYTDSTSGVSQVRYSNDGVWDTEPWESPSATKPWTLTAGDGTKTTYYQVRDEAGLLSITYSDDIGLDSTEPTGSVLVNSGDPWTTSDSVSLSLTYSDATSGVDQVRYSNDGVWDTETWESPSAAKAWVLLSGDGTKTVYYQLKDNASVESVTYSDDIGLDTTVPTGSIVVNSGDTWSNSTSVTLDLTYSDPTSGPDQVRYSNDGVWDTETWEAPSATKAWALVAGDGTKSVYYQIRDNAGLESITYQDDIGLDTTPPTGSIIINNDDTWASSTSVTLTVTYADSYSDVYQVRFSNDGVWDTETWESPITSKAWTLDVGDGSKTVYYQVVDNAGLISSYSDDIVLDTTPPTGSIVINNGDAWTTSTFVVLTLTYSDATSGVNQVRYSNDGIWDTEPWESPSPTKVWTLLSGDGTKTVYYQMRDNASVESVTYSDDIGLDTTEPTGSILINNGNLWTTSTSVTLTLTYSDITSGVYQVRYSNDGTWDTEPWEDPSTTKAWALDAGDGGKTVYYQVKNTAGLESSTYFDDIGLDMTAPTGSIAINSGDAWTISTTVTLALTYSDDTSGVAEVRYSNDGVWDTESWESPGATKSWTLIAGDGTKTVYYQAKDTAGLESATYSDDIGLDTAIPTGSIIINSGDTWTASTSVSLTLTYVDSTSGVSQVRYSNDGVWDTELWESPTATEAWTLRAGDGTKTVYYQIRDTAGLESTTYQDDIGLDITPPTGSIMINNDDTWTTSASVTLALTYSDATSGVGQVRYSNDGVWDTEEWESPTATKAWTLAGGDGSVSVWYQMEDNAGNVHEVSDSINVDTTQPTSSVYDPPIGSVQITTSFMVGWSGSDGTGSGIKWFDIQYRDGNAGTWTDWLTQTTLESETFGPTSPITVEDLHTYYFQVRVQDNAGNWEVYPGGDGDTYTTIDLTLPDKTRPTITNLQPSAGSTTDDNRPAIGADYSDDTGIDVSSVVLEVDGVDVTSSATVTDTGAIHMPTVSLSDGSHEVYLEVKDSSSNHNKATALWTFFIDTSPPDTTPPLITNLQPPDGSTTENDSPTIGADYSDDTGIDVNSVLLKLDGTDMTSSATITPTGVSYTPSTALSDGLHNVYLEVKDSSSNHNKASETWSFTIGMTSPDTTPPAITNLQPLIGSTTSDDTPTIGAEYTDESGIDTGSVVLKVDGSDVTSTATVTETGVYYTPETPLSEGTHEVYLEVRDSSGNQNEAIVSWSFTVAMEVEDPGGDWVSGLLPWISLAILAVLIPLILAALLIRGRKNKDHKE